MKKIILLMVAAIATLSAFGQKIYKVGDYYNENGKEGVVFWVDSTGEHGKIVSMKSPDEDLQWTSDEIEQNRLIKATNKKDGAKNMEKVKQIPNWEQKYPAFAWCANLGEEWYLPAKRELLQIERMCNKFEDKLDEMNLIILAHCWSSTESRRRGPIDESYAHMVIVGHQYSCIDFKADRGNIHPVAVF